MIRVLLVDGDATVRATQRRLLAHADDVQVVAEAADGAEAVELALRQPVDVVLVDVRMAATGGLTAAEQLAVLLPRTKVIVLTTYGDQEFLSRALAAGVAGFLLKDIAAKYVLEAIRIVVRGDAIVSPHITRALVEELTVGDAGRAADARRLVDSLTGRERDVLALVGLGMSNAEAGRELRLGEGAVNSYVAHILGKLGCANRLQAAILAFEAGLTAR